MNRKLVYTVSALNRSTGATLDFRTSSDWNLIEEAIRALNPIFRAMRKDGSADLVVILKAKVEVL